MRLFRGMSPLEKAKSLMAEDAGVKRPRSLLAAALVSAYERSQKKKGKPSD